MADINEQVDEILDMERINLGDMVQDTVTGYIGVATCRNEELGASPIVCVVLPLSATNDEYNEVWFPETRLEKIKNKL